MTGHDEKIRIRGYWWLPWRRRKNEELILRSFAELFFVDGGVNDAKKNDVFSIARRLVVIGFLAGLVCMICCLSIVVVWDHSAIYHQCEGLYFLWPQCVANIMLYAFMLCAYIWWVNPNWFRGGVMISILLELCVVILFMSVSMHMAPICQQFYQIKYASLLHAFTYCGIINTITLVVLAIYECCVFCVDPSADDPIISTNVFFKQDETWDPPLFEQPDLLTYKEGVNQWIKSSAQRVAQLQTTLEKTEAIRTTCNRQSTLLRQVTSLVVETEAKVTRTATLMDDQTKMIQSFNKDFEAVVVQLQAMDERSSFSLGNLKMCTSKDVFCWGLLCCMLLIFVLAVEWGINKWFAVLGLQIPMMEV